MICPAGAFIISFKSIIAFVTFYLTHVCKEMHFMVSEDIGLHKRCFCIAKGAEFGFLQVLESAWVPRCVSKCFTAVVKSTIGQQT